MDDKIQLRNKLKQYRIKKKMSQGDLAATVGVSRNTISSIETGQYCPTAKLAYAIVIALDKTFEEVFYFENYTAPQPTFDEQSGGEAEQYSLSDKALKRMKEFLQNEGWSAQKILEFLIFITQ